ncbi:hypothetical protein QBC38DRAFT_365818 [Podospora fimiseda]|uniref:Kelch repeat-containing protein n=1 Tax=Podospora fimiseda TaxID=252190 RepID=A0AAN7BPI2_9PEZI|nr:hypothetical protein QBC38DRAFT_365818 [Podospora fimiseda]
MPVIIPPTQLPKSSSDPEISLTHPRPVRPKFHHRCTNDRLREGSQSVLFLSSMSGKIRKDRKSVFKELGLDTDQPNGPYASEHEFGEITGLASPASTFSPNQENASDDGKSETGGNQNRDQGEQNQNDSARSPASPSRSSRPWYSRLTPSRRPKVRAVSSAPPPSVSSFSRVSMIALLIAVVLPAFSFYNGDEKVALAGVAEAGVISGRMEDSGPFLEPRADSPTKVCKRWAHQSAHLNGTLYIYGGQATNSQDQKSDAWNNNFLALDLTKSWDISSPALHGLPQPNGPPAVSLGYLWNDYNNLYLYGGQFSDTPFVEPAPVSVWRFNIPRQTWTEFKNPKTSGGNASTDGGIPVQRAAEGAGVSVPELGLSWYFGGHYDEHTTPGWSNQTPRLYLKSLLEFTHPGYANDGVYSLRNVGAEKSGVFRNITEGGLQVHDAFSERADAVLVFVPGWGDRGVLIGLAGGSVQNDEENFIDDLEILDVYDIAHSQWYHQKTTGERPTVRVNLCAVTASAPDASSFQIYVYGGQNLTPYRSQTQYSDMYILSIPAFHWIKVSPNPSPQTPSPRAGHTCNLRDGQILIIGGYTGENTPCDPPGIYVFNATSLTWSNKFTSLSHPPDLSSENSVLANSFGYQVPAPVYSVIGGDANGGATLTTPSAGKPTSGPFATGKPPIFTITESGTTATITHWGPGATTTDGVVINPGKPPAAKEDEISGGLIAAGIIAALAGLLAGYLGYCAWLYRRQVRAYKSHLAISNRYSGPAGVSTSGLSTLAAFFWGTRKGSKKSNKSATSARTATAAANMMMENEKQQKPRFSSDTMDSWFQQGNMIPTEPKIMFDDYGSGSGGGSERPSPGSGITGTSGTNSTSLHPSSGVGVGGVSRPATWWREGGSAAASGSRSGSGQRTQGSGTGTGTGSGITPSSVPRPVPLRRSRSTGGESNSSTELLLDGQEPSFFSVVMGPRRALRVVNGLEGENNNGGTHE